MTRTIIIWLRSIFTLGRSFSAPVNCQTWPTVWLARFITRSLLLSRLYHSTFNYFDNCKPATADYWLLCADSVWKIVQNGSLRFYAGNEKQVGCIIIVEVPFRSRDNIRDEWRIFKWKRCRDDANKSIHWALWPSRMYIVPVIYDGVQGLRYQMEMSQETQ